MNSIACNVVILPSKELAAKAISASRELVPLETYFTLEDGKCFPHASVYMLQLGEKDLTQAEQLLREIADKTKILNLTATQYYQSHNYFDAEYRKIAELATLQKNVIELLNPIRDGMRENDKVRMAEAGGLALENYQKYGWNSIGELYRPHMTITRFKNEQRITDLNLPLIEEFNGHFTRLGLFEMGENGTCIRKIAEFVLSQ